MTFPKEVHVPLVEGHRGRCGEQNRGILEEEEQLAHVLKLQKIPMSRELNGWRTRPWNLTQYLLYLFIILNADKLHEDN